MSRRLAVAAAASLSLIPLSLYSPAQAEDAAATPAVSPLVAKLPKNITGYRWKRMTQVAGRGWVRAQGQPFEIRATRASYDDPIKASWVHDGTTTQLPEGMVTEWWMGLNDFATFELTKADGTPIDSSGTGSWCPNGYENARALPDGPARNPYPNECPYNPYTLGSVMGLQQSWQSATGFYAFVSRKLKVGTYKLTMKINPDYVNVFGISAADATATSTVTVVAGKPRGGLFRQANSNARRSERATLRSRMSADRAERRSVSAPSPAASAPTGAAAAPAGVRPDLRSLPAWGISMVGRQTLGFAATVWNGGTSPLVVDGFRRDGEDVMDAYQYFFDTDGNQVGYEQVGEMEWDGRPSHDHWHFTDFATYELLDASQNLVQRSQKEAFCLANTDAVDYTLPAAQWHPEGTDLSTACGGYDSLSVREELSVGSGDTYSQMRAGQAFNLKGLPNGTYYIRVTANPEHTLVETDTTNNVSLREIKIGGTKKRRTVTVSQVGIINEDGGLLFGW